MTEPDPRYTAAVEAERRKMDAITRAIELLVTHPGVDPVERLEVMLALHSIDRRSM